MRLRLWNKGRGRQQWRLQSHITTLFGPTCTPFFICKVPSLFMRICLFLSFVVSAYIFEASLSLSLSLLCFPSLACLFVVAAHAIDLWAVFRCVRGTTETYTWVGRRCFPGSGTDSRGMSCLADFSWYTLYYRSIHAGLGGVCGGGPLLPSCQLCCPGKRVSHVPMNHQVTEKIT